MTAVAWTQLLEEEEAAELTVRYVHGRADPTTQKVIERLLRLNRSDRDQAIQMADTSAQVEVDW